MPDFIHLALPATLILLVIGWSLVIHRAQKADRALVKARKERRAHVCGRM